MSDVLLLPMRTVSQPRHPIRFVSTAGLATHDDLHRLSGKLSGVISERDYITKIALLGKTVSDMPLLENSSCVRSRHHAVFRHARV
jgi:hypothetical protein